VSRRPAGDAIDVHVGKRVRERRVLLGMSQKILAKSVGVSFQQIQKNERGTNRIGASRMFELSKVLDVPVSFFFDDLPPQPPIKSAIPRKIAAENRADVNAGDANRLYSVSPWPATRRIPHGPLQRATSGAAEGSLW